MSGPLGNRRGGIQTGCVCGAPARTLIFPDTFRGVEVEHACTALNSIDSGNYTFGGCLCSSGEQQIFAPKRGRPGGFRELPPFPRGSSFFTVMAQKHTDVSSRTASDDCDCPCWVVPGTKPCHLRRRLHHPFWSACFLCHCPGRHYRGVPSAPWTWDEPVC